MKSVEFQARELTPWANPVSPKDLKEGSTYFMVDYVDDDMLVPVVETVVFVGRDLHEKDAGLIYFQDVESYRMGIRHDSEGTDYPARFFTGPENETGAIFEFEFALEELMKCFLRRRDHPGASQT